MTREQAQEILLLHRATSRSKDLDAGTAEALRLAASDPELSRWFEQHREFHAQVEKQLTTIEPPADLKSRILASANVTPKKQTFLRRHQVWAIAAAIVVLFALSDWWLAGDRDERTFANFRSRMSEF